MIVYYLLEGRDEPAHALSVPELLDEGAFYITVDDGDWQAAHTQAVEHALEAEVDTVCIMSGDCCVMSRRLGVDRERVVLQAPHPHGDHALVLLAQRFLGESCGVLLVPPEGTLSTLPAGWDQQHPTEHTVAFYNRAALLAWDGRARALVQQGFSIITVSDWAYTGPAQLPQAGNQRKWEKIHAEALDITR